MTLPDTCVPRIVASYPDRCYAWKSDANGSLRLLAHDDAGVFTMLLFDATYGANAFGVLATAASAVDLSTCYAYGLVPLSDTLAVFLYQTTDLPSEKSMAIPVNFDGTTLVLGTPYDFTFPSTGGGGGGIPPTAAWRVTETSLAVQQQNNDFSLALNNVPLGPGRRSAFQQSHVRHLSLATATPAIVFDSGGSYNYSYFTSSNLQDILDVHWGSWTSHRGSHGSDAALQPYSMGALIDIRQGGSTSLSPYSVGRYNDLSQSFFISSSVSFAAPATQYSDPLFRNPVGDFVAAVGSDGQYHFGGAAFIPDGRVLAVITYGLSLRHSYLYEFQPVVAVGDFDRRDVNRGLDTDSIYVRRWLIPSSPSVVNGVNQPTQDGQWYIADPGLMGADQSDDRITLLRRQGVNANSFPDQNIFATSSVILPGQSNYDLIAFALDRTALPAAGLLQIGDPLRINHSSKALTFQPYVEGGNERRLASGQQPLMLALDTEAGILSVYAVDPDGAFNHSYDQDRTVYYDCGNRAVALGVESGAFIQNGSAKGGPREDLLAFE